MSLAAPACAPPFGNLVHSVSAALSDPCADDALNGLDCRRVPYDMLNFCDVVSPSGGQ